MSGKDKSTEAYAAHSHYRNRGDAVERKVTHEELQREMRAIEDRVARRLEKEAQERHVTYGHISSAVSGHDVEITDLKALAAQTGKQLQTVVEQLEGALGGPGLVKDYNDLRDKVNDLEAKAEAVDELKDSVEQLKVAVSDIKTKVLLMCGGLTVVSVLAPYVLSKLLS